MNGYEALAPLSLEITDSHLRRRELDTTSGFTRVTTEIVLEGPTHVGRGEDVTYEASHHDALASTGLPPLEGAYDFGTFAEIVGELDAFPGDEPERPVFRNYRRWGFESAALDLALRQANETLASALDGSYEPVRFLVSTGLGSPPALDRLYELQDRTADVEFKLDATDEWDQALLAELRSLDAVRIVDLKGQYEGTDVDGSTDPDLYRRVLDDLPDVIVEDPALTPSTEPVLDGAWHRLSWDAPVHHVDDLEQLPDTGWLNVKPSRFGSVRSLLAAFEYCERSGVDWYVGGQFELGPGRSQLHALASLFCPDAPNDVAPAGYNDPAHGASLPDSPLTVPEDPSGFDWPQ